MRSNVVTRRALGHRSRPHRLISQCSSAGRAVGLRRSAKPLLEQRSRRRSGARNPTTRADGAPEPSKASFVRRTGRVHRCVTPQSVGVRPPPRCFGWSLRLTPSGRAVVPCTKDRRTHVTTFPTGPIPRVDPRPFAHHSPIFGLDDVVLMLPTRNDARTLLT